MNFIALILSLPTENATLRMRAWRTLKNVGAVALRDGVYLLPNLEPCRVTLSEVATDVKTANGSAYVLSVDAPSDDFVSLFDRGEDYAALAAEAAGVAVKLTGDNATEIQKATRKMRKAFASIVAIDYFPGEAQRQTDAALQALELRIAQIQSPDEPHAVDQDVSRLDFIDYQGRTWGTRQRPWVDRMASAWLIRKFIDPKADILWLASPADLPVGALGFDFDGATFTHVGHRVTFEVIAASFGLETEALKRLGAIVHFLDVGGLQPPEAAGLEGVLKGMRAAIGDDDALMSAATLVFDALYASFGGA